MTKLNDGERLAVVETKIQNVNDKVEGLTKTVVDGFKTLNTNMEQTAQNFATKEEVNAIRLEIQGIKNKNGLKDTLLWVGLVASAIINIVFIYQLFSGLK